ncbi:hypothetical protein [Pseudomonas brassicacearum]|uniref:Uncharacterized protein n=1 Tax=Pseudomonas brassicacearum TaxID=930166 RepID=A0A423H1Y4_9PSED|nr:hypothetical protein [Pseudomonas brassicacearum]RON06238.1 hypothetical protein BK658_00165 [Pseudomonas brassicacearum]
MSTPTNQQVYAKAKELVEAIGLRDSEALQQDFRITNAVADEIYESIDAYFDKGTKLSIAPEETAFDSFGQQRPFIDAYETNDKALGLECVIFADGTPSEAILHIEVSESNGQLAVYYKYIGS